MWETQLGKTQLPETQLPETQLPETQLRNIQLQGTARGKKVRIQSELNMAYSEDNAGILRDELAALDGIREKRMFGGLCFMLNGNMLCGVHKEGGMARVGKENEAAALELEGVEPLSFTGRKMGGMVDISEEVFADESSLRAVLSLAREFVESLPPK